MMLTSPEEPKDVVSKLRWKSASVEGILKGHYRLVGNIVSVVLVVNIFYLKHTLQVYLISYL